MVELSGVISTRSFLPLGMFSGGPAMSSPRLARGSLAKLTGYSGRRRVTRKGRKRPRQTCHTIVSCHALPTPAGIGRHRNWTEINLVGGSGYSIVGQRDAIA